MGSFIMDGVCTLQTSPEKSAKQCEATLPLSKGKGRRLISQEKVWPEGEMANVISIHPNLHPHPVGSSAPSIALLTAPAGELMPAASSPRAALQSFCP